MPSMISTNATAEFDLAALAILIAMAFASPQFWQILPDQTRDEV